MIWDRDARYQPSQRYRVQIQPLVAGTWPWQTGQRERYLPKNRGCWGRGLRRMNCPCSMRPGTHRCWSGGGVDVDRMVKRGYHQGPHHGVRTGRGRRISSKGSEEEKKIQFRSWRDGIFSRLAVGVEISLLEGPWGSHIVDPDLPWGQYQTPTASLPNQCSSIYLVEMCSTGWRTPE